VKRLLILALWLPVTVWAANTNSFHNLSTSNLISTGAITLNGGALTVSNNTLKLNGAAVTSGTFDHSALSNVLWTASGHTGTVGRIAGFLEGGAAGFVVVGSGLELDGSDNLNVTNSPMATFAVSSGYATNSLRWNGVSLGGNNTEGYLLRMTGEPAPKAEFVDPATVSVGTATYSAGSGYATSSGYSTNAGAVGGVALGGLVQTGALTSAQWTWASITNATPRTTTTVNVLDFGASGSPESTTTIGTLTNGSDVVFVASTNTFAVGQTASIQGAGWSGNYHMGTITSMTATSITFTPVTFTTVTSGKTVRHDETAAIQAAINACTNGGTVFMPAGFYRVNSINYAAGTGSGRIVLPTWGYSSTNQAYALRIVGEGNPAIGVTNGCTIIQTEQTLGYILSGKATAPPGGWSAATHLWLSLENLLFRTYENPQIGALNLEFVAGATLKDVVLDVGKNSTCGYNAACTLTNGYNTAGIGVAMPGSLNTSACSLRNVAIQGYYIGVKANGSEHLLLDKVYMTHCTQGLAVNAVNHGIIANQLETEYCDYGIYITGAVGAFDVRGWNTEHTHVADLYDLTSQAFGVVSYSMLQGPIITGGTNLTLRNLRNGSNVVAGAQTFLGPVSGGGLVPTNRQLIAGAGITLNGGTDPVPLNTNVTIASTGGAAATSNITAIVADYRDWTWGTGGNSASNAVVPVYWTQTTAAGDQLALGWTSSSTATQQDRFAYTALRGIDSATGWASETAACVWVLTSSPSVLTSWIASVRFTAPDGSQFTTNNLVSSAANTWTPICILTNSLGAWQANGTGTNRWTVRINPVAWQSQTAAVAQVEFNIKVVK
jgi:hypothetical protein